MSVVQDDIGAEIEAFLAETLAFTTIDLTEAATEKQAWEERTAGRYAFEPLPSVPRLELLFLPPLRKQDLIVRNREAAEALGKQYTITYQEQNMSLSAKKGHQFMQWEMEK